MADDRPKMSDREVLGAITGLPLRMLTGSIPDATLALAAGLDAADPELGWDHIASILERLGLGTYKADDLVRAVDGWLLGKGTGRAKVSAAVRGAKRR